MTFPRTPAGSALLGCSVSLSACALVPLLLRCLLVILSTPSPPSGSAERTSCAVAKSHSGRGQVFPGPFVKHHSRDGAELLVVKMIERKTNKQNLGTRQTEDKKQNTQTLQTKQE